MAALIRLGVLHISICFCASKYFVCIVIMVWRHSQKVQGFPADQNVHAVPSFLSLLSLQQLPSHHGNQQVPITHTARNIMWFQKNVNATDVDRYNNTSVLLDSHWTSFYMNILVYCTYSGTSSSSRANRSNGAYWALETRKDKNKKMSEVSRWVYITNSVFSENVAICNRWF